jgi:hypothetical protein
MGIRDAKGDSVKRKMATGERYGFTAEGARRTSIARRAKEKQIPRYARDDTRFPFEGNYNGVR